MKRRSVVWHTVKWAYLAQVKCLIVRSNLVSQQMCSVMHFAQVTMCFDMMLKYACNCALYLYWFKSN